MSALSEASTPAQDTASAMDQQQLHQLPHPSDAQQQQPQNGNGAVEGAARKGELLSAIAGLLNNDGAFSQGTLCQTCVHCVSCGEDEMQRGSSVPGALCSLAPHDDCVSPHH